MTQVLVFPGQGSQAKGMGAEHFDQFPEIEQAFDKELGYSIRALCLEDSDNRLASTQFTQPALFTVSVMAYRAYLAESGREPDFVAGHSLGEYTALYAAGAFDFETGLRLVKHRGALMGKVVGGGMAAVIGADIATIEDAIERAGATEVDIANLNAPTQTVLAGPTTELNLVGDALTGLTGVRFVALNVRTAFHSRHMRALKDAFAAFIADFSFQPLTIPTISK